MTQSTTAPDTSSTPEGTGASELLRGVITGVRLSHEEARTVFAALGAGELSEVQTAALLAALHARGETPEEVAGAAEAFRAVARPFPEVTAPLIDVVGTGGDGVGTINISTAAGLTAASMGLTVAKHGNRAVSSKTGAADVVSALGLPLDLSPLEAARALERDRFTFLFAQAYHPAMRHVAPVRAALRAPTIFNVLGPLINPARLTYQLLGVANPGLMDMLAQALARLGRERALVVNGLGLDEIALHGTTTVREVSTEGVRSYEVTPEDLGVPTRDLTEVLGGAPQENASFLMEVFSGGGREGHRDAIAVNAGAMLYLAGRASTLREGTQAAREHLASGAVATHLESMRSAAQAPGAAGEEA